MKITATSTFHGNETGISFVGCEEGINTRQLKGPRAKYCRDYSNNNSHVCGCGYPIGNTDWEADEGFEVIEQGECGKDGDIYGTGFIKFRVINSESMHY